MPLRGFLRTNRVTRVLGIHLLKRNALFRSAFGQWCYRQYIEHRMAAQERLPPLVHIETTNVCNARCTMCSYPIMERRKGYMTDELFAKVLRDCADMGVKDVNLQFLGEPLLDRKIGERIRAAKEFGFRVQMVTNASLLDESMSSQLLASGLDELKISMDGFTEKTYEDIRIGLKFERVRRNILGFLELSSRFNGPKPRVVMIFVRLPENKKESREFCDFWRKKADLVLISQATDWAGQVPLVELGATYTTIFRASPAITFGRSWLCFTTAGLPCAAPHTMVRSWWATSPDSPLERFGSARISEIAEPSSPGPGQRNPTLYNM